jgi:citrate lyase beta subunit
MKTSLSRDAIETLTAPLRTANAEFTRRFPGESDRRQPVHSVYGGAHLFKADTAPRLGALALRSLEQYAPDAVTLAEALSLPPALAEKLYERVVEKLRREPVEDYRLDFEDGYGNRPDDDEDGHAASAAAEVARANADGTLPPFVGIRIKPFSEELHARSVRTLDLFLTTLVEAGSLPANFVVTLPKVTIPEQVTALAGLLEALEPRLGLDRGALQLEIMVETTQAIIDANGQVPLPRLVAAAGGRCVAAHFGTYDYTASCQITAAHQHMTHPACDFARHVMQVSLAGTGIWLSDGATNVMPVPVHRASPGGPDLTPAQVAENRAVVHRAWKLHFDHIQHSLANAYYQGWDLHPAQLVTRYAAVYAFFLESMDAAGARLANFVEKAAQATLVGEIFDDAATGQGLLNFFLRAINCGALAESEAVAMAGLTLEELRSRSFVQILNGRQNRLS